MRWFERQNEIEKSLGRVSPTAHPKRKLSLVSVRELLNEKDKKTFIRKLFQNDPAQFENFIVRLDSLNDWSESFCLIETEFARRVIDQNSSEARRFTDMIFKRFFPV